ncbi:uncharacterized protein LOC118430005 [Branchiostoma floridae]|uniref:Uncharacterized protein LOC118430005 n=1 Tax=Branchiostoma floridae TaxID=7739 RepID=A0A9J7MCD8_BRAFL|nr:uncharacterized protein LOC118430005 [Branchiostoma floridae]
MIREKTNMGVRAVIFLGCATLLFASTSAGSIQKQAEVVEHLENGLFEILEEVDEELRQLEQQQNVPEGSSDGMTLRQTGKAWRDDLRCGAGYPAPNGQTAQCDPAGRFPCCSTGKWCGNTAAHCTCSGCVHYKKEWRDDLRCGAGYPAPNGQPAKCNPGGRYPCCAPSKWCGNTSNHCYCRGCVNYGK